MATKIRLISCAALAVPFFFLAACGGGGGGAPNPPPVVPPTTDTKAPEVVLADVRPSSGATGVERDATIVVPFDEELACGAPVIGLFGEVNGTLTCENVGGKGKLSLKPTTSLNPDVVYPFTVVATDRAGNRSNPYTGSFRVRPLRALDAKAYVGTVPNTDGSDAVSVINLATGAVKSIGFPAVPGFGPLYSVVVDPVTARAYFAGWGAAKLYAVDIETDTPLPTIPIDAVQSVIHVSYGLTLTESDFCVVLSASFPVGASENRLQCWDRYSLALTYTGTNHSLADTSMITTGVRFVTQPAKKLYVINALRRTVDGGTPTAGTPGTLAVLNPTTYAVERTIPVGATPRDFAVDPVTGLIWVANAGDKTVSIVNPANGQVETMELTSFVSNQAPRGITIDRAKDRVYITDWQYSVYIYRLSTREEITRVNAGAGAYLTSIVGNDLWVLFGDGSMVAINRDTLTVQRTVTLRANSSPNSLATYGGNSQ